MAPISEDSLEILLAYVTPGFVFLAALARHFEILKSWLGGGIAQPSIGGFAILTILAIAAGTIASLIRWAVVDTIHHRTGIEKPKLDFTNFGGQHRAFGVLIRRHLRYHHYYANLLVSLLMVAPFNFRFVLAATRIPPAMFIIGFVVLLVLLWMGSRDSLEKYYRRGEAILAR